MHVTMKKHFCAVIFFLTAGVCFGEISDSSDLIFNDSFVHDYHIGFYIREWRDTLVANKSNDEAYMPARFTWHGPNGDSIVLDSIGVRYKGNSSYNVASEKKPFKFYFNKYRKNQLFFSLEKLNFSNGVQDPTMMREKIAYDILGKYMPAPRAAFATLTVEDSLIKAFYTQVEQVDELFLKRHFGNDKGNLYKAGDQGASLAYKSPNQSDYESDYELKTNEKKNDWTGLITLLHKLNTAPDSDFTKDIGMSLDIDNCIRYLAFNMVNANFDSYTGSGRNFYLYDDEKSGKFKFIPWDVNLSFAAYAYTWGDDITAVDAFAPSNLDQRPLEKRIMADDSLNRVYAEYMKKMIAGPLGSDSVAALAYRLKAVVDSSVRADARKFYSYEEFATNIDSELEFKVGPQTKLLFGLVSFTAERGKNLIPQIDKELSVTEEPREYDRRRRMPLLQCSGSACGKFINISYTVHASNTAVVINLYNARGELLRSFSEGNRKTGLHSTGLDIQNIPAGYYAIVLKADKTAISQGILLVNP